MAESLNQTDAELEKKLDDKSKILKEATEAALKLAAIKEAAQKNVTKNSNEISTIPAKENKDSKNTTSKEDNLHVKVPLMITRDMKQQLLDLGWKIKEINNLTLKKAWETIKGAKVKEAPTTAVDSEKTQNLTKEIEHKIDLENTRKEFFKLKSNKTKGKNLGLNETEYIKKLKETEENYQKIKNEIFEKFKEKGENEKAHEFFTSEVELKRKNDLENGPLSARIKTGISNGIEKWDNFGTEPGLKGAIKRITKMSISLGLIGISSSLSVEVLTKVGIGSASALGGGTLSYLERKLGLGVLIGTAMGTVPEKYKKWVSVAMLTFSIGVAALGAGIFTAAGATAGIGVAGASAFGYGLSSLTKKYDKKIKNNIEESKNKLSFDNLKLSSKEYEEEIEKILKANESARIWGKVREASVAMAGSIAFLEVAGNIHDSKQAETEAEHKHQEEIKHEAELKQQEERQEEIRQEEEIKHQEEAKHLELSTIHKGEGIEHSFIRQIESDHKLAQELGFKGDLSDAKALHEFAQKEAHVIARDTGYVDDAGHEIRVTEADKIAYEIKMENGHIVVEEKTISGELLETHHEGDKFEENTDKYEYNDGRDHRLDYQQENFNQTHTETDTEKQIINEYEETSNRTGGEHTDASKSNQVIEYDDTSKPTGEQHISHNTETKPLNVKVGEHIYKTEEDWAKAPENIYHIPLKDITQINEIHNSNIDHITNQASNEEELQKIQSTLKEGHADAMIESKETEVKEIYRPTYNYINKLHDVTGLEPRGETPVHLAETNEEYIHRGEMKAAEMHRLDEIKLHNNLHESTSNTDNQETTENTKELQNLSKDIPIQKNEHFPLFNPEKIHFSYDENGNPTNLNTDGSITGFIGNPLLKEDFIKEIHKYSSEHKIDEGFQRTIVGTQEKTLYMNIATYDNIKENVEYVKESEFIKNTILNEIKQINKYGDIVNYEKLPREFWPEEYRLEHPITAQFPEERQYFTNIKEGTPEIQNIKTEYPQFKLGDEDQFRNIETKGADTIEGGKDFPKFEINDDIKRVSPPDMTHEKYFEDTKGLDVEKIPGEKEFPTFKPDPNDLFKYENTQPFGLEKIPENQHNSTLTFDDSVRRVSPPDMTHEKYFEDTKELDVEKIPGEKEFPTFKPDPNDLFRYENEKILGMEKINGEHDFPKFEINDDKVRVGPLGDEERYFKEHEPFNTEEIKTENKYPHFDPDKRDIFKYENEKVLGVDKLPTEKDFPKFHPSDEDQFKNIETKGAEEIKSGQNNHIFNPDEILNKINKTYQNNLNTISNGDTHILSDTKLDAKDIINENIDNLNGTQKALASYVQELEKITNIHPRGTTIFQSPESIDEYINRVSQTEAKENILLKATLDTNGIAHVEKVKF